MNSELGDSVSKQELQMAENVEGIIQMVGHRLDTLEKGGQHGNKVVEVGPRLKLPLKMVQLDGEHIIN